jgi:hypothetical protein
MEKSDEMNANHNVETERAIMLGRNQAARAVRELNEIAFRTDTERLFAFLFYQIAIAGAGDGSIKCAEAPVKLEFAFFHLSPYFRHNTGAKLDADTIQKALDAVNSLYEAQALGASRLFDAENPMGELSFLRMCLYFEATLARGSAYSVQLRNQILGIQAKFDDWFEAAAKIRPSRAVVLIEAALRSLVANSAILQKLAFDHGQLGKEAFRTANPDATIEQAFAVLACEKLSDGALDVLPVAATQIKLEPRPTPEEWAALINLIGCSPSARSAMNDAWEMYRRPLFVLPDHRILPWALSHTYEQLWTAFEEVASQSGIFHDGDYAETKKRWSEDEVVAYLKRLFPPGAVFHTLDYPDPEKKNATAELDVAVWWPPFLIFVEVKFRKFHFESHLRPGWVGHDIKASVGDAFEQARRASRYLHSVKEAQFVERNTKRVLTIAGENVRRLYFTTVTKYLPISLTAALSEMRWLFKDGEFPWALSLDGLDNLSRFCPGPDAFLHYIERRLAIQREGIRFSGSELDLFGYYLRSRLHPTELHIPENAGPVIVCAHGEQEPFDKVIEKEFLGEKSAWHPDFELPEVVLAVLRELRKLNEDSSARWITFSLLSFSRKGIETVNYMFQNIRKVPLTPDRLRGVRAVVDGMPIAFTATDDLSRDDLRERTVLRGIIEKYRHKASKCISFGIRVSETTIPFEHAVWLEGDWAFDPEGEKLLTMEPDTWPMPKTSLPGRNDKCLCGSGKKFKKCCLPLFP